MRKLFLLFGVCAIVSGGSLHAQLSKGGLPLSFQDKTIYNSIPVATYANPDWDAFLQQEKEQTATNHPLQVALLTGTDFGFPQSGQLITLDNGQKIWRGKIQISGAPAIGLLYDRFFLPKGVRMFLSNANQQQVMGAFDNSNNIADGVFSSDAVQGDVITVELNIDANVDMNNIKLHIDKAMVFHRAIEHLKLYSISGDQPLDQIDAQLNGRSSVCNINAICPQGTGYGNNRTATVQIIHSDGSACSGTLVNNTGNTTASCKPYILTASHCNQSGSEDANNPFNQYLVRFNFENTSCTGGAAATTSHTLQGVRKVARSAYSSATPADQTKGDFMLYELLQNIPTAAGATLSGWNNSPSIANSYTAPKKFIGFHHPYGDNKKLSTTQSMQSADVGASGSHWEIIWNQGYVAPGSSGSGLFNGDGLLVGIASVAGEYQPPASCKIDAFGATVYAMDAIYYSKFAYDWDYSVDGTATTRKLKPWLDPANTGATTIATVKSDCSAANTTSVNTVNNELSDNISVYPNPATGDNVQLQYNLQAATNLYITLYDVTGKAVYQAEVLKAQSGMKKIDVSSLSNGIYLVKVASEEGFATKKIMVQR